MACPSRRAAEVIVKILLAIEGRRARRFLSALLDLQIL
jgi:hypothetical protein